MTALLVDLELVHDSGIETDADHMTWTIRDNRVNTPPTSGQWTTYAAAVEAGFTDVLAGGTGQLRDYLSEQLSGVGHLRAYNVTGHLDGSPHGSPILDAPLALGGVGTGYSPIPAEVAAVITWYAEGRNVAAVESEGLRPKARRTGHTYIGPLSSHAFGVVDQECRFTNAFRDTLKAFAGYLLAVTETEIEDTVWEMCVWSREDQLVRKTVGGHVDNAPDIQRRRGVEPTSRAVFGFLG